MKFKKHYIFSLLFLITCLLSSFYSYAQTVNYQQLYNSVNFSKVLDPALHIGATGASSNVTLSGGAAYNIPIDIPVGTNGMQPSISIDYNSQSGNGIAGRGWVVNGLSSISRSNKKTFLDNEVAPVECNNQDGFSIDGVRLYSNGGIYGANGATYIKEEIDFSTITSYGIQGSGPIYFTVIDRTGTKYEYGSAPDSRVLTDDGNHIISWRISKIIDVHGNYIDFVYQTTARENLIREINFTGNSVLGFAPYNSIKFEYLDNRIDQNTEYLGGASFSTKKILGSITIYGEGGISFKKYKFEYARDDLYSYLQEVKEFGADNFASQLNSTIFLYGQQGSPFVTSNHTINNLSSINGADYIQSLDLDADGIPELLLNHTAAPGNYVANIDIYQKGNNGN